SIIKNIKNNAKPIYSLFGSICWVARDVRIYDNTMIILVKLVINIIIPGAIDKMVNKIINFTDVESCEGSALENIFIKSFISIILHFLFKKILSFFRPIH